MALKIYRRKKKRQNVTGTIYLVHFKKPFKGTNHYLGWTEGEVALRMASHIKGTGARLLRAVGLAGIGFSVVATTTGDRHLERRLKNQKNCGRLCPICSPAKGLERLIRFTGSPKATRSFIRAPRGKNEHYLSRLQRPSAYWSGYTPPPDEEEVGDNYHPPLPYDTYF